LLGDWELDKEFDHWVSTGPKSYSSLDVFVDKIENLIDEDWSEDEKLETKELLEDFEIISMKCETKVKGFTLNFENSQVINYNSMLDMIKNNIKLKTIDENKITRNSKKKTIENKRQEKTYKLEFNKRMTKNIDENHIDSFPWGY
jgi:hypothetical protein